MDYYPLSDLLYRTVALTDDPGEGDVAVVEAYDTDAYGNTLIFNDPGDDETWFTDDDATTKDPICPFIFTGRRYDPETEIYFYRARYYHQELGRFLSRDVRGSGRSLSPYAYVRSQPFSFLDPTGLVSIEFRGFELEYIEAYRVQYTLPTFDVELVIRKTPQCHRVVIDKVAWTITMHLHRDESYPPQEQEMWQYHGRLKELRSLSNSDWYRTMPVRTPLSVFAHELEHARQFRTAGEESIGTTVQSYNTDSSHVFSEPKSAQEHKRNQESLKWPETLLLIEVAETFRHKYPAGLGFRESEAGEEQTVKEERRVFESQYEVWRRGREVSTSGAGKSQTGGAK